jgi:hypothetical protein
MTLGRALYDVIPMDKTSPAEAKSVLSIPARMSSGRQAIPARGRIFCRQGGVALAKQGTTFRSTRKRCGLLTINKHVLMLTEEELQIHRWQGARDPLTEKVGRATINRHLSRWTSNCLQVLLVDDAVCQTLSDLRCATWARL